MKVNRHTGLPWSVAPSGGIAGAGEAIVVNDGKTLERFRCKPVNNGFGRAKANARFIVRACNAHYELLEACKAALVYDQPPLVEKALKAAIEKAKGKVAR